MDDLNENEDEWQLWWDARVAAFEQVLGKAEEVVGHSLIPFHLGPEMGGGADLVFFKHHVAGTVAVTSELIGCEDQIPSDIGNYELMICEREEEEWGAELISKLAHYTLEAPLNPGETMDIGPAVPRGSSLAALLFLEYARFQVREQPAGLLLCVGITKDELQACQKGNHEEVVKALKQAGVYPFTDLRRKSVLRRRLS